MSTRKVYLDWIEKDETTLIPADFPDLYWDDDYYKVNRWFAENKRLLLCRWGHCCDCEYFTPEIKEQTCQHDPKTWNIETCHSSNETVKEEIKDDTQ